MPPKLKRGNCAKLPVSTGISGYCRAERHYSGCIKGREGPARASTSAPFLLFPYPRAVMAKRHDLPGHANENAGGGGDAYDWIGEWLCEYVDGTMDPSMQAVFEEYMEANPELAEHVERLCRTRTLLNGCECDQQQPSDRRKERLRRAKERLQQEIAEGHVPDEEDRDARVGEIESQIEAVLTESDADRDDALPLPQSTRAVVAAASAMTLMLGVGLFAGAVLFAEPPAPDSPVRSTATEQTAPDRAPAPPSGALPHRRAASGSAVGMARTPRSGGPSPLFPLKKMPMPPADTAPSPVPLMQQTGLNPLRP